MKLEVHKMDGRVYECMLLKHKDTGEYSYINLTRRHICPCRFKSIEEALEEMRDREDIEKYIIIDWQRG